MGSIESKSIFSRYDKQSAMPALSQSVSNPANGKTFISFELPERSSISLSLKHTVTEQETVVVNGMKNPGIHIVAVDLQQMPIGMIEYTLRAGNSVIKKIMEKK
ncbi:MAG: hypothetical protein HYV29_01890 [Ignavibacteriales bacterium]|nr:hypothetical protein [Ignavibacteriales bacterium]